MPPEKLGRALREARETKGLSVRQLAKEVGLNASNVLRFEAGDRHPTPEVLKRLAEALELDDEDLAALAVENLPSLAPYLRARYDLSETQVAELEAHFKAVTKKSAGGKRRRA